jgi:hypothetical protein
MPAGGRRIEMGRKGVPAQEVALYRGDRFVDIGTVPELAVKWGIKVQTLYCCMSHADKKRRAGRKLGKNPIVIVRFDINEEDDDED